MKKNFFTTFLLCFLLINCILALGCGGGGGSSSPSVGPTIDTSTDIATDTTPIGPATGTPVIPPATGTPVIPPATGTPVIPPATGTPVIPPATGTPVIPPATGTPVIPPATGTPVIPPATSVSVLSSTPNNGSKNIGLLEPIVINFSKSMHTILTKDAIEIIPSMDYSYAWSNSNQTLTISHTDKWQEKSSIQISINTTAEASDGGKLGANYLGYFETTALPYVESDKVIPTADAKATSTLTSIVVEFSKEVNQNSAEKAFYLEPSVAGNFSWQIITDALGNRKSEMTFKPISPLEYDTEYTVNVYNYFTDLLGNQGKVTTTWSFTTEKEEGKTWEVLQVQVDEGMDSRKDHAMVSFNDKLWIIGGYDGSGNYFGDIYNSSDGKTWTKVATKPEFARRGHACCVYNNKIWLSGGISDDGSSEIYHNDVWSSSNGSDWVRVLDDVVTFDLVSDTSFQKRAYHNMLTYKDSLWVMLGEGVVGTVTDEKLFGDIWYSKDGITWTDISQIDAPRKQAAAVVFNNKIIVAGGYGTDNSGINKPLNTILTIAPYQSGEGFAEANWVERNSNLTGRYAATATVHNGRIWLIGGKNNSSNTAEVLTTNDGYNWYQMYTEPGFIGITSHQSQAFNNKIIISCGEEDGSITNRVWSIK